MKAVAPMALRPPVRSRLLHGLPARQLEEILAAGRLRHLSARQIVLNSGDPGTHVYLLVSGRARVFLLSEEGERRVVHWMGPGESFGLTAFHPEAKTVLFNFEMVENGSAIVWERDRIRALAAKFPQLWENLVVILHDAFVRFLVVHSTLAFHSGARRLQQALLDLSHGIGRAVPGGVEIQVTNEELAGMAHLTIFTASRYLSEWRRRGVIVKKRGRIVLRSPGRLLSVVPELFALPAAAAAAARKPARVRADALLDCAAASI